MLVSNSIQNDGAVGSIDGTVCRFVLGFGDSSNSINGTIHRVAGFGDGSEDIDGTVGRVGMAGWVMVATALMEPSVGWVDDGSNGRRCRWNRRLSWVGRVGDGSDGIDGTIC